MAMRRRSRAQARRADVELPVQAAFKLPNKIAAQGEPLPVEIVVVGGKAVDSVTLYYRTLGEGEFVTMPMTLSLWNVYQATIPARRSPKRGWNTTSR